VKVDRGTYCSGFVRASSFAFVQEQTDDKAPNSNVSFDKELRRQVRMKIGFRTIRSILFVLALNIPVFAQSIDGSVTGGVSSSAVDFASTLDSSTGTPYRLERGDNEFGFWGGFSPKATTIFAGLHEDEAADRKFFLAAFRYGRTLAANDHVALQYTLDAIPVAIATGVIVSRTTVGGVTTFQRETAYGVGLTPAALQLDFANGSKVHPFIHVNGGFLGFNKAVPIEDSGQFAFVGEAGGGLRFFTSESRAVTLGVRFHHISNGNRSGANRGLNQFVIYAGFSIFK
jgi:Lipid A 3-O-deacylase (PagL)